MPAKAICPACGEWVKLSDQPKIGQKLPADTAKQI